MISDAAFPDREAIVKGKGKILGIGDSNGISKLQTVALIHLIYKVKSVVHIWVSLEIPLLGMQNH